MGMTIFARKIVLMALILALSSMTVSAAIIVDHSCISEFEEIPTAVIDQVKSNYRIFYGHTSHGSQLVTGMSMLRQENSNLDYNNGSGTLQLVEYGDDLGLYGDTSWAAITRSYLNNPSYDFNVVIWSWCGGAGEASLAQIQTYLDKYTELENEFPGVTFVYMTGHLDGSGDLHYLYPNNNLIRSYCYTNDKVLYDFADIEQYDPDGTFYLMETDACNWCSVWCATHDCPSCIECAHSHCYNCYRKGKGFWWMMATLTGWSAASGVDDDGDGALSMRYSLEQNYPNPFNPSTSIDYTLAAGSRVSIVVYNILGEKVTTLEQAYKPAGAYSIQWDGNNSNGNPVPSGVYLYLLRTDTFSETRKMILQK